MLARHTYFDQETRTRIIDYSMEIEGLDTPDEVLNTLDDITSEKNPIRVHGANRFSVKVGDWRRIELGKNVLHPFGCSSAMAGGVGRVCGEGTPHRVDDRKDVPSPLHMDRAFEAV